jgi:hypothetical protein
MSSLVHKPTKTVGRVATATEEITIAANIARVERRRRLRLRAAVVTVDQLLKQLEVLNLQGRSRSLSAWHRRLYSLGRMPNATRLDLTSETSPRHVMNELIELRQRLIRDLADSEVESPGGRGGQASPPADGDGSPPKVVHRPA